MPAILLLTLGIMQNTERPRLISRNIHPAYEKWGKDFHAPRLNKVVTDAAPVPMVDTQDVRNNPERYVYYARVAQGHNIRSIR